MNLPQTIIDESERSRMIDMMRTYSPRTFRKVNFGERRFALVYEVADGFVISGYILKEDEPDLCQSVFYACKPNFHNRLRHALNDYQEIPPANVEILLRDHKEKKARQLEAERGANEIRSKYPWLCHEQ
jgi:hypothetical protein